MGAIKLGRNATINRNTGTYGSPVWSNVALAKDVTLNLDKTEADASSRFSGWTLTVGALKNATVEFEVIEDTTDANWTALKNSFINGTEIDIAVLNGPSATSGSNGVRAYWEVMSFNRNEPLTGIITRTVTMKPTWPTDGNMPVEMTV